MTRRPSRGSSVYYFHDSALGTRSSALGSSALRTGSADSSWRLGAGRLELMIIMKIILMMIIITIIITITIIYKYMYNILIMIVIVSKHEIIVVVIGVAK